MELVCILAPAAQDARLAGVGSEGTGNCPTISERDRYWVSVSKVTINMEIGSYIGVVIIVSVTSLC